MRKILKSQILFEERSFLYQLLVCYSITCCVAILSGFGLYGKSKHVVFKKEQGKSGFGLAM